jgi:hypothetical protein
MRQETFFLTAGVVFLLIALGHVLRVALRATVIVEGVAVPMWVSPPAVIVMGYLAYEGFRLWRKSRART